MMRRYRRLAHRPAHWIGLAVFACFLAGPAFSQQQDDLIPEPPSEPVQTQPDQPERKPHPPTGDHEEHGPDRFDEAGKTPDEVTMSHRGEFIRAQGNEFTMRAQGRQHSHTLGDDAKITLNGRKAELSDLRPGDQITVVTPRTELGTAIQIQATRGDAAQDERQAQQDERQPRNPTNQPNQREQDQPAQANRNQQRGQDNQGALGVLLGQDQQGQGVLIREVAPNSAAARAGIRPGDRIVSIGDQQISSPEDVLQAMQERTAGEEVSLQIARNDRTMNVSVALGAQREMAFRQNDQGRQPGFEQQGGQQENQAWLGIMLRDDRQQQQPGAEQNENQPQQQQGAVVAQVYPSGPAARAGFRSGDVIVKLGDQEVNRLDDLYRAMDQLQPGDEIEITVLRNGEEQQLTARLAARNDFFGEQFRGFRGPEEFFGGRFPGENDPLGGAPEHSMMLEQQRHLATQHQRIEELLNNLLEEVKQLRQEVQRSRGAEGPRRNRQPADQ